MRYEYAFDLQRIAEDISRRMFPHIRIDRIKCFRSYGSSSYRTIARCHALGKLMQLAMNVDAFYALEFLSEQFDNLNDVEKMKKAASFIKGKHDFKSFEAAGSPRAHTIRTISHLEVYYDGKENIKIEVSADGFLRYMVRNITGTLVQTGLGKISPDEIPEIIEKKDRGSAGMTAPPHGLFLKEVIY